MSTRDLTIVLAGSLPARTLRLRRAAWIGLLAFALLGPPPARGQSDSSTTGAPHASPLQFSGSWRLRVEGWSWFEGNAGNSDYAFPHSLLRLAIRQEGKWFEWQVELAQAAILGLPADALAPAPQGQLGLGGTYLAANGARQNNASAFVKQAYLRFKALEHASVRLGRFEYFDGAEIAPKDATLAALVQTRIAQRLIGNFGWAAVGRSYDGLQLAYNSGKANFTFVGARPTRGVFQTDAMGDLDVDLYYGALTIPVQAGRNSGRLRLFGLGYIDHRTAVLKTDNRPQAARAADRGQIRIGTYGADYVHVLDASARGKFDVVLWGALQTGSWGVQRQRAAAFVGELGWQPAVRFLQPWLSAGYSYGSGDGNPNDSRHGTFFQVLPTPRPYARFPFYNMENNQDFYGALNLRPHPKLALRSEMHALRLSSSKDLWYQGGGAFQRQTFGYVGRPSNGARSLANVWDLSADCQIKRALGVGLYYGYAWGKSVIASIYPRDRDGQFAYLETNLRF
ncbi:MAG TPA: alginate export family protein [Bryobacterales bacterium]|nr:alginate export family protein [Bryobacterales bacterium]